MSTVVLKTALAVLLATSAIADKTPPPAARTNAAGFDVNELARVMKRDLESISGPGTVDIRVTNKTFVSVRIAVTSFSSEICGPIYDRERELYRLYPDIDFDFYFDRSALARAIKTDLESISGPGTVDVSVDSKTLFNVRIGVASFSSEVYTPIYDRELELYRLFPDLNFDFYLRPKLP
jgi:copper chaperone CopZ